VISVLRGGRGVLDSASCLSPLFWGKGERGEGREGRKERLNGFEN